MRLQSPLLMTSNVGLFMGTERDEAVIAAALRKARADGMGGGLRKAIEILYIRTQMQTMSPFIQAYIDECLALADKSEKGEA